MRSPLIYKLKDLPTSRTKIEENLSYFRTLYDGIFIRNKHKTMLFLS